MKSPNKYVNILTDTVFNVMVNFVPNKTIILDDRDPPWVDKKIKGLIHKKNLVYKTTPQEKYFRHSKSFFSNSGSCLASIENAKLKYYQNLSNKLSSDTLKTSGTGVF